VFQSQFCKTDCFDARLIVSLIIIYYDFSPNPINIDIYLSFFLRISEKTDLKKIPALGKRVKNLVSRSENCVDL
jgi:hypothetical protein